MKIARHVGGFEGEGPPQLVERAIERAARWQHADDRVREVIEQNRAVDDRGVRAELVHPKHMTQDDDLLFAGLIFAGKKRPAERRADFEDVEEVGGDPRAAKLHGLGHTGERDRPSGLGGHVVEDSVVFLPVQEVQGRDAVAFEHRRLFEYANDPIGVLVRQRLEQDGVDEREDRRVGADSQRKRQKRDACKPRVPDEASSAVAQILKKRHEQPPLSEPLARGRAVGLTDPGLK
jgi:hypothetical protein